MGRSVSALTRRRFLPRPRRGIRLPRLSPQALAGLLILAAILVGLFFWVRQSSLVAVRRVSITGVSGPDAAQIRTAISQAALGMSTIDVDAQRLHQAVAPYPVVHALSLSSHFPHGLSISVSEEIPVAVVVAGGQRVTVAADGRFLPAERSTASLPTITLPSLTAAGRVTGTAQMEVGLLAAAPYSLIPRIASAAVTSGDGLTVTLRSGPAIVFGSDSQLAAKWRSAVAVLAAPSSAGATYIDVTSPSRPAAGAGSDAATGTPTPAATTTASTVPPGPGG
jgi:cell division protein FtsQ